MANKKITELTELSAAPASGDFIEIVDVSDTTMSADGTNKKITSTNLLSAASSTPRVYYSPSFQDITYFTTATSGAGSAVAFGNPTRIYLHKGSDTTGGASIVGESYVTGDAIFDKNPHFWFTQYTTGTSASNTWECYIALGRTGTAAALALTQKHIGFNFKNNNGTAEYYASCASGTTQTTSADIGTAWDTNTFNYFVRMTSGVDVKYYRSNTLVATLTTNLPSGNSASVDWTAVMKATAGTSDNDMNVTRLGYSFEAL